MGDVRVKEVRNIDPVRIQQVDQIAPVTIESIKRVEKVAPVAVHIKELNQIDPLSIESARIDGFRNIDPLQVDRLNVTRLPVVNLSVNQIPTVDLNIRRLPPVSIAVQQAFDLPSSYMARARFLGFEILRLQIQGRTRVIPRDCTQREQAHVHERSFPDVAAVGNPAIPTRMTEHSAEMTVCRPPVPPCRHRATLNAGPPRFQYKAGPAPGVRHG
jgi:hypothetical protein